MEVSRDHRQSVMEWLRTWNSVDHDGFLALLSPDRFDAAGLIVENNSWYDSVDWFRQIGVDPNAV